MVIFRILNFYRLSEISVSWFRGYFWPWMLHTTMFLGYACNSLGTYFNLLVHSGIGELWSTWMIVVFVTFRSVSSSFVLLNFSPNPCARMDGGKALNLHTLQQIMLVLFEIYIRKWITKIESWFWSFHEDMNGITDADIFVRIGYSIHTLHETTKINFQFLNESPKGAWQYNKCWRKNIQCSEAKLYGR